MNGLIENQLHGWPVASSQSNNAVERGKRDSDSLRARYCERIW
jgi:hypothetical protein